MNAYRPRQAGFWNSILDFIQDNNGPVEIYVPLGEWMPSVVGSCGPHPDIAAMLNERPDSFDLLADKKGWDCAERKEQRWFLGKLKAVQRLQWLEYQLTESLLTGSAPLDEFTPAERCWFLKEIKIRRANQKQRHKYSNNTSGIRLTRQ